MAENYSDFVENKFKLQNMYIEASAGTGKTYSVIETIKKIVSSKDLAIPLEQILVVTYTEKAVGELKSRVFESLGGMAEIYTIHSFCQKMLSLFGFESGQSDDFEMVGESEFEMFVQKLIRDKYCKEEEFINYFSSDGKFFNYFLTVLQNGIGGFCDDALIVNVDYESAGSDEKKTYLLNRIAEVYSLWKKEKEKQHLWSFEDMLDITRKEVCKNGGDNLFASAIRERYRVVIIDEFQDTNQKQWDIFGTLFLKKQGHNVIVVGDPKQSIYSFQKADVNVYKKALEDIADIGKGKGFALSRNYRSTNQIIEACNVLFDPFNDFFSKESTNIEFSASLPPAKDKEKRACELDCKVCSPVWMRSDTDKKEFSKECVNIIKECCKKDKNGKTRLQIFDGKDSDKLKNVDYSDFTILYRKRREVDLVIKELKKANIPYSLAKDDGLFDDKEIDMWIAVLSLINADDIAGDNKKILNRCLYTDFFQVGFSELDNADVVDLHIEKIKKWRELKDKREWATLFEKIYSDTKIEATLRLKNDLISLGKVRQLSNYITNYLYKNNSDLSDIIVLLGRLKNGEISIGKDENRIERASDRSAVSLMTIHNSKGLQFPVVISFAGCENGVIGTSARNDSKIYTYHKDGKLYLGFDGKLNEKEQEDELRRLLYVDFTRATSLLILPIFNKDGKNKAGYGGVNEILGRVFSNLGDDNKLFSDIQKLKLLSGAKAGSQDVLRGEAVFEVGDTKIKPYNSQKCKECIKNLPSTLSKQNSYSSVSHSIDDEVKLKDTNGGVMDYSGIVSHLYDESTLDDIYKDFEKGARIGTAVHEIFENLDFAHFKKRLEKDIRSDKKIVEPIAGILKKNGYYDLEKSDLVAQCISIVYNTLNANFPEIDLASKAIDNKFFTLCEIDKKSTLAEVEFDSLAHNDSAYLKLKNYWTGSIDLVFKRRVAGRDVYCIADWKTDTFDYASDYADYDILKSRCDEHYSVQRVLYSYMLVSYLSQLLSKSRKDVFEQNFGGVYYIFVKGCRSGRSYGIYPHTWQSFDVLETAYKNLLARSE